MSAICQVTGRTPSFGKSVSHSHRRTSRRWNPNVQRRRFYLPSEGRTIVLNVSTKGLKIIDRDGIESVVAQIRARGEKV
ncbi:50S ribosomal protein L28 [Corynebacterium sp. ES2794-CONJ1]|uniref:50S ribosomal protein L28 n=1 Tax=unclassified Corynebacterium TaxID=2624378 RepID=UPI00216A83C0|nr:MULTISPECIES: 50S ribosomal protein L28 [unclassified Corynebacterium]MCS4490021.1 50S ribosomal protein L28 [Corynebacterium sp. ES2775-CONJ]MCS4491617.1 50S ribosomal protein L28 [Corynebacterium sp. ES2715-CONJ3]MCS4531721.1 50S ribosomal protein L28 [Corynebacterium sp. ES2730-CONJ]MCU9519117.1 50S ribosomal protein L28 [Corynebacterium sp. ES2794-CONJ1]